MNKTPLLFFIIILGGMLLIIGMQNRQKQTLKTELAMCENKTSLLLHAIDDQNMAIENMALDKKEYEASKVKNKKLIIEQIQAIPAPVSKDGITCEEALEYIIKLEELE